MLYVVATPIGNLKDITLRALETLKSVDEIACEDKRQTLKLLNAYDIKKPLFAYHKFNEKKVSEALADKLAEGVNIALVSDAGMPLISDPGCVLIKTLIERGLEFTVVPGSTAFVSALVLSGLLDYRFSFIGFLPEKNSERKKLLARYKTADCPLIFYCAPHDIDDTVCALYSAFGERRAVACREITKAFEQRVEFTLSGGYQGERRGEFVIIVEGASSSSASELQSLSVSEHLAALMAGGMDKKQAIKEVAKARGVNKNEIYMQALPAEKNRD